MNSPMHTIIQEDEDNDSDQTSQLISDIDSVHDSDKGSDSNDSNFDNERVANSDPEDIESASDESPMNSSMHKIIQEDSDREIFL